MVKRLVEEFVSHRPVRIMTELFTPCQSNVATKCNVVTHIHKVLKKSKYDININCIFAQPSLKLYFGIDSTWKENYGKLSPNLLMACYTKNKLYLESLIMTENWREKNILQIH